MRSATVARRFVLCVLMIGALIASCGPSPSRSPSPSDLKGIHKIQHVVVIMQENRSFDSYFGTYPGAEGLPRNDGQFTVCVPDPRAGGCQKPYHDAAIINGGGKHQKGDADADIDGGRMDGFIGVAEKTGRGCGPARSAEARAACNPSGAPDVMGYHDAREIPNYWTYAQNFVLADHMFQADASWSKPAHLYLVSNWSATCTSAADPSSCHNNDATGGSKARGGSNSVFADRGLNYAWTDVTYLLHRNGVSWAYYVEDGTQPDCTDDTCDATPQHATTPTIWNPLPSFTDVREDGQQGNIQGLEKFHAAARSGNLPQVSWIAPSQQDSEHPPASIATGQAYTTRSINELMQGPDWTSTAIFLTWDDWGGFYDHVQPPSIDVNGYGLRVPFLLISPYAKRGYIDSQTLSFDAFNKFIEDDFLSGQRLDPKTDGRPDPRPTVREGDPQLGTLAGDFDFTQRPRPPLVLPLMPPPGPASMP
ncbi:MAG: phospholipase [Chloroflexi bacterium]|nr:MAG: phospholipase [Chloroflexota bacterium]